MTHNLAEAREQLMEWATRGPRMDELKTAKADFFSLSGEVRADEPTFDAWMDAFADWYLCDRKAADGRTPAEGYLADEGARLPEEDRSGFENFTRTRHSLFVLESVEDGALGVRDLATRDRMQVVERRKMAGVRTGDVFEARVIPGPGAEGWRFTGALLFHPSEVRRIVIRAASQARKEGPQQFAEVMRQLCLRRLKVDRYRKLPARQLYLDLLPKRRWLPW